VHNHVTGCAGSSNRCFLKVNIAAENVIKLFSPIIVVEWIKSPEENLKNILDRFNYVYFEVGINLLAIHNSDPTLGHVKSTTPRAALA
jgi:hypothetical protein